MQQTTTTSGEDRVTYHCARCGAQNRIPRARVRDQPKCGSCHRPIFPSVPVRVTRDRFRAEVEESPIPVLIDFWADWCGPCHAVAPVLEAIARERAGRIKVVKVNVDEEPALAARFQVRSIPKLVIQRGPIVVAETAGAAGKAALEGWIDRFV